MPLTLTLQGETLGDVIAQMRFLLDTVDLDEGTALLRAMHEDPPPAVRRAPKGSITAAEAKASVDGQAPPCTPDDLRETLRKYVKQVGEREANKRLPKLLGAARVSDIPVENLWRVRAALIDDSANFLNQGDPFQ